MSDTGVGVSNILSLILEMALQSECYYPHFSQWENWGPESFNNLPKISQQISNEKYFWPQSPWSFTYTVVMLWFIIWNRYLVFLLVSGTKLLKPLEFPKQLRAKSFLLLCQWDDFWTPLKDGSWLPGEPSLWLEGWNFQFYPPDLWGGEEEWRLNLLPVANDLINQAYVMKPP